MSAREFAAWREYHRQYPLDDESVHCQQIALLSAVVWNQAQGKNGKMKTAADFMLARTARKNARSTEGGGMDLDFKFRTFFARATNTSPTSSGLFFLLVTHV